MGESRDLPTLNTFHHRGGIIYLTGSRFKVQASRPFKLKASVALRWLQEVYHFGLNLLHFYEPVSQLGQVDLRCVVAVRQ